MIKTVLTTLLLLHSTFALAADPCAKASTALTPPVRKMYARSISSYLTKFQPPAQIKLQKRLTVANWTAVWATPAGMEQGVFFYSDEKSGVVYHNVWGGYATAAETADVAQWITKLGPTVPPDFAQCVAQTITAGH